MQIPKELECHLCVTQYRQAKARWDAAVSRELETRTRIGKVTKVTKVKANSSLMQQVMDDHAHACRDQQDAGLKLQVAKSNLESVIRRHISSAQRESTQATIEALMAAV